MSVSWTRTTAPVLSAITLADAKAQTRIVDDESNGLLLSYIASATDEAEQALGYGLLTQSYKVTADDFYDVFPLPMCLVLQSIDSVKYYDADGVLQTLSSTYYTTDTVARPARLVRAADMAWPSLQADRQAFDLGVIGHAIFQRARLAHIEHIAALVHHAINPRRTRQQPQEMPDGLDTDGDGFLRRNVKGIHLNLVMVGFSPTIHDLKTYKQFHCCKLVDPSLRRDDGVEVLELVLH